MLTASEIAFGTRYVNFGSRIMPASHPPWNLNRILPCRRAQRALDHNQSSSSEQIGRASCRETGEDSVGGGDKLVTGVQTCALPIYAGFSPSLVSESNSTLS